jgi:hypothetical protein
MPADETATILMRLVDLRLMVFADGRYLSLAIPMIESQRAMVSENQQEQGIQAAA